MRPTRSTKPWRFALAVCGPTAALLFASWAHADPPYGRVALDYTLPVEPFSCPDSAAFATELATRLGYDPVVPADASPAPDRKLSVTFTRSGAALKVTLRLIGAGGAVEAQRDLASETGGCTELGKAAALAGAILLDPRAMFPRPPPAPPTPTKSGESLDSRSPGTWPWYQPPPSVPKPPPPTPPPPVPWLWHGGLMLTGCDGCGPAIAAGGAIFAGMSRGHFGLDVDLRADLPSTKTGPAGSVSASRVAGELFPNARLGPLRLGPLGAVGALFGESGGESHASVWSGVGARAALDLKVFRMIFVRISADGLFLVSRVALRVEGAGVWSTPAVAAAIGVGAGVEL